MTRAAAIAVSFGCALGAFAGSASAQQSPSSPEAAPTPGASPVLLPEVVTSATRAERDSFDLPVAIDSVDKSVIQEDKPQVNLSEALNRVPGIAVLNRQNYAQDLQISSRGFGARSAFGVRGIRLIADGIPATLPDGQAQASSFNLGSAERIEVMRGPFSSLYGNAAGGVIQLFSADGPPEPTLSGSLFGGSYGTYKGDVQFGGQSRSLNYLFDASRFHTDGYRDHSTVTRDLSNAKLKAPFASGTLTMLVNTFDQPETQDPLGLSRAQVIANPRQADPSATLFNTRKSARQNQVGLVYDINLGSADKLQARTYLGDRQITQFLAIPLAAQAPATSAGGVVDQDFGYEGLGLRWTRSVNEGVRPLTFTAGVDYDRMAQHRKGYLNNNGIAGALKRDEDNTVTNTGLYAQLEWKPAPRWSVSAGLRYSRVSFNSKDYFIVPGNPNDSGAVDYSKTTPVAGIVFNAAPAWNVYANLGRGFETPTLIELAFRPGGATGLNFALQPATSLHKEIGVKGRIGAATRVNLALFHINTSDEIVVNSAIGGRTDFKNASKTRREGAEISVESHLGAGFEAYLAYTWLDAQFSQMFTTNSTNCVSTVAGTVTVPAGNKLPGVPAYTLFGELIWRHAASGFHTALEIRSNGKIYVNDFNCASADAYTVANLRAGFEQRGKKWRLTEFVRIDNISDRQYIGSVIIADGNNRFYEPSPGRNYLVGINAQLSF
ncbi:MAG TPA: TonB-dependent receptor [Burkholderiales bacterium]|jgi:iron complex outermembrane receptor protein|nr:TonB-dependent receptor [Burkholderiales bacterium]